jgi:excisionase family DNA binding protein
MSITGLGQAPRRRGRPLKDAGPPLARQTYTIEEVGQLLGLSRNRAFVAAREDRLPVPIIRIGRRMLVSRPALDRFLETGAAA